MINNNGNISIPKDIQTKDDLDYDFLRKLGIEHLQKLSGKLWTDYNPHDPGITILEVLSYAITDLGYRLNLPIEDLLAGKDNHQQFLTAINVLPSGPITQDDYRKLLIDIEGVENAWIEVADCKLHLKCDKDEDELHIADIKGLYKILVDIDENNMLSIWNKIHAVYHRNRNLCEDLVEIKKIEKYEVQICTRIDLEKGADEELIDAQIRIAIDNYLCPSIEFNKIEQMLDKGYSTDDIFNGPILCNGFIEDSVLKNAKLRTEVRASDLIHLIMDINGVSKVTEIQINPCNVQEEENSQNSDWKVCIPAGRKAVNCSKSTFKYNKGLLPIGINIIQRDIYHKKLKLEEELRQSKIKTSDLDFPQGTEYDLSEYSTIQEHFPETYGISSYGLRPSESTERKSQAKQLQAYLLHFEQILSAYFSELNKVKEILAIDSEMKKTYFFKAIKDIPGISSLMDNDYDDLINQLNSDTDVNGLNTLDKTFKRRNALLDHLLARFEERFGDYAYILKSLKNEDVAFGSLNLREEITNNKLNFLKNYPKFNYSRAQAINYFKSSFKTKVQSDKLSACEKIENREAFSIGDNGIWNTENVSGFEKKITFLTGLKSFKRRNLVINENTTEEGFYLIEHSLLLPNKEKQFFNVEFYEEKDKDNIEEHRWRIVGNDKEILLSSSKHYHQLSEAQKEVNNSIFFAKDINNFKTFTAKNGKFYFNLVNPSEDPLSEAYILSRSQRYFKTTKLLKAYKLKVQDGLAQINGLHKAYMKFCCSDTEEKHLDPYSCRVSIIFPGYTKRLSKITFRRFIDDLIRKELPAHIIPKICFVSQFDLQEMQSKWKAFLEHKILSADITSLTNSTQELIDAIQRMNNVYHKGILHNCDNESTEEENVNKIILGQSNIGKLKN